MFKTESNGDGFSWHEEEETAGSVQETWHSCKFEEQRNGRQTLLAFQGSYHSTLFLIFLITNRISSNNLIGE